MALKYISDDVFTIGQLKIKLCELPRLDSRHQRSSRKKMIESGENIFVISLLSSYLVCCHGNPLLVVQGCRSVFFFHIADITNETSSFLTGENGVLTSCVTHLIICLLFVTQEKNHVADCGYNNKDREYIENTQNYTGLVY